MEIGYLGGIIRRNLAERRRASDHCAGHVEEDWGWMGEDAELFLHAAGPCCRLFTWDALAVVVRGHVRPAGTSDSLDVERVAEEVRCHYLEHGTLAVDTLEGSFTLAVLDGQARRVLLYRNLVGAGFTYYHAGPDGLLFGSNLAELLDASGVAPSTNTDALPSLFLYRCVPGRETLLDGFERLLPGEQVCWDGRGLTRLQRHTFASLRTDPVPAGDALERLEDTMDRVLTDCAQACPGAANLLSGGVDSSYLQGVWNRLAGPDILPPSFSLSVDHPRSWADTDYAVTASLALGSRHTLIPTDEPYAVYLLDALASTAEPPNHVQSAYFGHLARAMVGQGASAGLCGEGADSLFGLGLANRLHYAGVFRRLLPLRPLRSGAALLADLLRRDLLASTLRLANTLNDFSDLAHPVNRVASFADWPAAEACFGRSAVAGAAADRRALLDRYAIPPDPMERLHAAGFLGEAMDSASLWTTLFNRAGAEMLCPFLDSRILRLALNLPREVRFRFRRPKDLLKQALARMAPPALAHRGKLGFGQPIFEWLSPGGTLRPLAERIGRHDFIDRATWERALARPSWFLYTLLCYDLWHKLFVARSLPRPARLTSAWRAEVPVLAAGDAA
jgi:asparagine synthase (glutamine-hydrolysing)